MAQDFDRLSSEDRATFAAVGRVIPALTDLPTGCTGTLIDPKTILTAAHCVSLDAEAPVSFHAGVFDGRPTLRVIPTARRHHPQTANQPLTLQTIPVDLVLLEVEGTDIIAPIPLGLEPQIGETLRVLAYTNGRTETPDWHDCPVFATAPGMAILGCPARSGMSGAPVIRMTDAGPQVAAVISATANGQSYAAIPDQWARRSAPE